MKFFVAALLATADVGGSVADLGWLSGAWQERKDDGGWTEEYWTPQRGGLMIGAGLAGKGEAVNHFEHMRIVTDKNGSVAFYAMPQGNLAVVFPLVRQTADEVVFENPKHDYPQRVTYRRSGDDVIATISLIDGTRENRWQYRRPN